MFGQVVIGPPGSGKSTYCAGMAELLQRHLKRQVVLVNLDPANDQLPYKPDIDLTELVRLDEAMERLDLGPNGGLLFCMDFLLKNADWLVGRLKQFSNAYFLFDMPGQVELYTNDQSVQQLLDHLTNKCDYRLACVHLVDSHYCTDAGKFVAVLLTSLSAMLNLQLPHVNVLSKADLIEQYGQLPFHIDYFTDVLDLSYLVQSLEGDPVLQKYHKLDRESVLRLLRSVDQANGYVFGDAEERSIAALLSCAVGADFEYAKIQSVHEKYTAASGGGSEAGPGASGTAGPSEEEEEEEDIQIDFLA
uniref:GPN-loop GTPase 2 n=1 Tax=Macrostomum lignano TaxID=282301 RepID=A0A1I8J5H8_9PLAT